MTESGTLPASQTRRMATAAKKTLVRYADIIDKSIYGHSDVFEYHIERRPGEDLELVAPMPWTRADCEDWPLECPWWTCRYHLHRDCYPACALDVADDGEHTLEEIGHLLGYTRERIRQVEEIAMAKFAIAWKQGE